MEHQRPSLLLLPCDSTDCSTICDVILPYKKGIISFLHIGTASINLNNIFFIMTICSYMQ
jgi:hypothetical protein